MDKILLTPEKIETGVVTRNLGESSDNKTLVYQSESAHSIGILWNSDDGNIDSWERCLNLTPAWCSVDDQATSLVYGIRAKYKHMAWFVSLEGSDIIEKLPI